MGYRHYVGKITKKKFDKIKNLSLNELMKKYGDEDYVGFYDIIHKEGKDIIELGKYSDIGHSLSNSDVFDGEVAEYFAEYGLTFLDENDLLKIIESYKQNVINYFKSFESKTNEEKEEYFKSKLREWDKNYLPYNLDKKNDNIVNSWLYEYSIFDLVREYKNFDKEKELLILYGW